MKILLNSVLIGPVDSIGDHYSKRKHAEKRFQRNPN